MTYNIHSCIGVDRRYDPERIISLIGSVAPDVLAIQELRAYSADHDQFDMFARRLGLASVFGFTFRARRYRFGNALFVKGEVLQSSIIDLSIAPYEARCAIDAVVVVRGCRLRVIAAHLGLRPAERRLQLHHLRDALQARPEPLTLFMGDFNIFGPERRRLTALGAPETLPRVRTFPSIRPTMSLDRMWSIPPRLRSLSALTEKGARWASDHLPLVADLVPLSAESGSPLTEVAAAAGSG
jgi:endonuclease/exonuclease/phosphatase family metal-dependent hydrolase